MLTERMAGGGDAFLSTGFDNWKKEWESFKVHERSACINVQNFIQ